MYKHLTFYSDGGSRGNPGPAAIAFIMLSDDGFIQKRYSHFIGVHTNNQSEYKALIAALRFASDKSEEVTCYLDSELVVKQVNGEYSVKNHKLRDLWNEVQDLKKIFNKTIFISVPRTNVHIQKADFLLNNKLDEYLI